MKKIEDLTVTIVGLGVIGAAFAQSFKEIGIKTIYGIDIDEETFAYIFPLARKLALQQIKKLNASGFRLIVNNGESAGQAVFRTHIHIIPYYDN